MMFEHTISSIISASHLTDLPICLKTRRQVLTALSPQMFIRPAYSRRWSPSQQSCALRDTCEPLHREMAAVLDVPSLPTWAIRPSLLCCCYSRAGFVRASKCPAQRALDDRAGIAAELVNWLSRSIAQTPPC